MSQVEIDQLFDSIKSDNLAVFSSLAQNNLNLSFGRFPILTICYLYNSKKILKKYKERLFKIKIYSFVAEKFEIYKKFKLVAGRCLRLFCEENIIVSAIEMLAVLNKDSMVKKLFNLYTQDAKIVDNLKSIYGIKGQDFIIKSNKVFISDKVLTKKQQKQIKTGFLISFSTMLIVSLCLAIFSVFSGFNFSFSAIKVYSQNQLLLSLSSSAYISLQNDINLQENSKILDFNGVLEGNNHTLYLGTNSDYFIKKLSGKIKNLNIVYKSDPKQISSDFSVLVQTNLGEIKNVNIVCDNLVLNSQQAEQTDVNISIFANSNSGVIDNCSLKLNAQINANGRSFVSAFANKNTGNIQNCEVVKDSLINVKDANVGVIAITNDIDGKIKNCVNNASVLQTSSLNVLSPSIGGIALANYGGIENCYNLKDLSLTCTSQAASSKRVLLGGITSINYGSINKSLNKGNLQLSSQNLISYCGGITAFGDETIKDKKILFPKITNCGQQGNIDVTSQSQNAYTLVGGLAGLMYGSIENCYSLASFSTNYDAKKHFVGTCVGVIYVSGGYPVLDVKNNVVLNSSSTIYHVGGLIDGEYIVGKGVNALESQILTSLTEDEIKAREVFWNV